MQKEWYDQHNFEACKKHFSEFGEVICGNHTYKLLFDYCMLNYIKVFVTRTSQTQYEFIYQGNSN